MEEAGAGGEEDGSRGEGRGQSIGCTVTRQAFAPCVAIVAAEALAAALRDCDSMAACLPHLTRLVSALQATDAELGVDLQEHFALCFDGGGPYVAPGDSASSPGAAEGRSLSAQVWSRQLHALQWERGVSTLPHCFP